MQNNFFDLRFESKFTKYAGENQFGNPYYTFLCHNSHELSLSFSFERDQFRHIYPLKL